MNARDLSGLVCAVLPGVIGLYVLAKGLGWFGKKEGLDPLAQQAENKTRSTLRLSGWLAIFASIGLIALDLLRKL